VFSLGDTTVDINAEILLWDLNLTEIDGSSNKCLKLFEKDHATVQAMVFATTATICCSIFPFNILAKLAYLSRWGWRMTVDLFLNVFGIANGCTHRSLFYADFLMLFRVLQ
jgi:hypothetical protein